MFASFLPGHGQQSFSSKFSSGNAKDLPANYKTLRLYLECRRFLPIFLLWPLEFPSVQCYASLPSRLWKPEEGLEGVSFKFTKQRLVSKIYKPRLPIPAIMLTQGPWMAALALDLHCPHALRMGHYNIILQIV
jgi:hypothetical protein